jgi:hypothetical protein
MGARPNPMTDDSDVALYVAAMPAFAQPVFAHLRGLIHRTCPGTTEAIKWSHPHFSLHGEYLCILAVYPRWMSLTFWKQDLMSDPRLRGNSALPAADRFLGRLTTRDDLPDDATLTAMLQEAAHLNATGAKLPERIVKTPATIAMPPAFAAALAAQPAAQTVWDAKSPSWQKDYLLWISDAKTDATRDKRIGEALGWIADGKARFWKYQK